ncbi:MAG: hypothetical protein ACTSWX_03545 [Promethearchaeota archaeon]
MIETNITPNSKSSTQSIKSRDILLDQKKTIKNIENFLNIDFIKEDSTNNLHSVPIIAINWTRIRDIGHFMQQRLYNLENIYVSEVGAIFELNYIYNLRPYQKNSVIIIQTEIEKNIEPATLRDIFLNAEFLEKDINNRMGIVFSSLNAGYKENLHNVDLYCSPIKIKVPIISENERKYGIFNPIHENHHYFNFYINNKVIKKVNLNYGWLYKKIQPKLENANPLTNFNSIFSNIAKNQLIHLNLAYLLNLESILNINISNKSKYIRTLLAELERISSHILWFSNLAELLGKKIWVKKIYREYLELIKIYEQFLGDPYLHNTISLGRSVDITINSARELYLIFKDKSNEIFNEIYKFVYSNSNETRLSGIGIVSTKDAIKNGLSGPTIRGSGVSLDLRSSGSYLIYTTGEISQVWNVISFTKGDVFARTQVRLWEIHESFEICKLILKGLSTYELKVSEGKSPDKIQFNANKYLYSAVESPNGKLSMILRTGIDDLSDKFNTVRIINNYNFIGLEKTMLLDNEPNDAALIIHSLDLNFNLVDL